MSLHGGIAESRLDSEKLTASSKPYDALSMSIWSSHIIKWDECLSAKEKST